MPALYPWIPVIVAAALPALINPWGFNSFELPKTLFLRTTTLAVVLLVYLQMGERSSVSLREFRSFWRDEPILWPLSVLSLALVAATLFSPNRHVSIWGSLDRQQGLITWLTYIALFLVTAYGVRTRRQMQRIWYALVYGSAPVVAYALVQAAKLDPVDWSTTGAAPVLSTIGRSNFLGAYLVLVIPLTLGLIVHRAISISPSVPELGGGPYHAAGVGRYLSDGVFSLASLLLLAQWAVLALTQTRSAWLGLLLALFVFGATWGLVHGQKRILAALVLLSLAIVTTALLAILQVGLFASLTELPGLDRLGELRHLSQGSAGARAILWRESVSLIATRPMLGYGPDALRPLFDLAFPPEFAAILGRHVTADRAHNVWLDTALFGGLPAAAGLMFLLGALLGMVWMSARNASGPRPSVLPIALLAALLGHMADLQFSFEVTATAALFWIVAGLIVAGYHIARPVQEAKAKPSPPAESVTATSRIGPSGWLVAASMLTIWVISCVFPLWADAQFQRSLDPTLSPDQRYAAARSATRLWPREPQYKLWLSVALQGVDEFELAAEQLRLAQRQIPNDAQLWGAWGGLYAQWGDRESSMRDHALTSFRRAKELAPASAYYRAALAWTLIDDDQLLAGIEELESAARIDGAYGGMLLQTKSSDQRQNALGASAVSGPR